MLHALLALVAVSMQVVMAMVDSETMARAAVAVVALMVAASMIELTASIELEVAS